MILNKIKKMINNLGIDPDEWFKDPIEPPVGIGTNRYHPDPNYEPEEPPRPEEEIADWFSDKKEHPDESDMIEEEKTIHQKMYEIATARNNPFHVGGTEKAQSEVDYIKKHSPWSGGSENFQSRRDK